MTKKGNNPKELREEFKEKYVRNGLVGWTEDKSDNPNPYTFEELWSFISSALKEAREKAVKDYTKELKRRIGGIDWLTPVVEKKLLK